MLGPMPVRNSLDTNWVSLRFNSILTLSTWREHQVPLVKCLVLEDCLPSPHFRCQSRALFVTYISVALPISQDFP